MYIIYVHKYTRLTSSPANVYHKVAPKGSFLKKFNLYFQTNLFRYQTKSPNSYS